MPVTDIFDFTLCVQLPRGTEAALDMTTSTAKPHVGAGDAVRELLLCLDDKVDRIDWNLSGASRILLPKSVEVFATSLANTKAIVW